jgi:hypothetical protein
MWAMRATTTEEPGKLLLLSSLKLCLIFAMFLF